uniref:(northern house mosquito) hypothetical protein n=1 Tax=Culex pipiens TaxID=7175 RepID=A0A8D8ATM9_CULPI
MSAESSFLAATAAAAAARSARDGGSSMLMSAPASDRVNFLGHSAPELAQLKTSYIELDMRLMSSVDLSRPLAEVARFFELPSVSSRSELRRVSGAPVYATFVMEVALRCAQNELHMPLSLVSIMRGVLDPNANWIELRSLRRFASIRWSRSWFFCRMYWRRSFSASCIARRRSSTCDRRSFSRRRRSSIRRRRSSSFCSRNFCAASACALSSSSLRCRSSFWRSFVCFIRSSRSRWSSSACALERGALLAEDGLVCFCTLASLFPASSSCMELI